VLHHVASVFLFALTVLFVFDIASLFLPYSSELQLSFVKR